MIGRHSCLPDCSRIFAEFWPLANGSRPIYAPVVLVTQISLMTQIFLRGEGFVPQISQIYTDFFHHDFSSSDFTDDRKAFLLAGLLTDFRGILAAGQWLAPYICSCCFGHADFADDADFSSLEGFVPQISQIYTDFLWNLW